MTFIPTRTAGLERLNNFLPRAGRAYAARRNLDLGPDDRSNTSCLSPYTRTRLITEREIVEATLKTYTLQDAEKFVQEVFWRTYFKGRLEREPWIWSRYCEQLETLHADLPGTALGKAYNKAITGQTGIKGFDDWAKELVAHNYLHNHARMWFASIWIFTLDLPWELGADFFMQHLLDGDPASNTLSWRWVGGLHTKGKTYLARPDNIEKFTAGRFRPDYLAGEAPALEEYEDVRPPRPLPDSAYMPDAPFLWLMHEDDLAPIDGDYAAKAGLILPQPPRQSAAVTAFRAQSVTSACGGTVATDAQSLIAICKDDALSDIVMPHAPAGHTADAIAAIKPELTEAGINLRVRVRDWDTLTWPWATAGFFKVKKKIPRILDGLNQGRLL